MNYNLELAVRASSDRAKITASSLNYEAMRQWPHNHPQFETWYISAIVRPAVYDLRNQDGSQEMRAVKAIRTKFGSGVGGQVDQAVTVGFYGSRRDDHYIYALKGVEQLQEEGELPPTQDWYCEHANRERDNSWTATAFAFASTAILDGLASQAGVETAFMPRFRQGRAAWVSAEYRVVNPEDEDYDFEIGGGDPYQLGPWLFQRTPGSDFIWRENLGNSLSSYVTDWSTFSADSLYITDGDEVVLGWFEQTEDGEFLLPKDYLTIFDSDPLVGPRKTVSFSRRRRDGADTLQCGDFLCTPLRNTFSGEEAVHVWQISTSTLTATEIDLVGASSGGTIGAVWGNPESNLPESWVGGNRFILQDGSGGLYGIDPVAAEIDWMYDGSKAVRPFAVRGERLVSAYETSEYDTVIDVFASTSWDDTGETEEERDILAPGKSIRGGLVYLRCETGAEIDAFEFEGEEDAGVSLGPKLETRTSHDGTSYTCPVFPTDIDDEYWFSGWGSALLAMRNAIIPGEDAPEAPGEFETYPYATATWANDLYESINHYGLPPVSGTEPGDAWLAECLDLFSVEREAIVRQAFEIFAAQPGPQYYLKRELWRSEWHSHSLTGADYDNLHTRIAGTTYFEAPGGPGGPEPFNRGIPSSYEGTEEAGSITDTESPHPGPFPGGGEWWTQGIGVKTYTSQLVKVWSNVQEEYARTKTATPQHATGPIAIGLGLIVHGPSLLLGPGADAHWVARLEDNPSVPAWTFTVESDGPAIEVGNVWMDEARVWIEYNAGAGWKLVGLKPDTGLPDESDPEILLDSLDGGRVVFDGTNVHDNNCAWAIEPV